MATENLLAGLLGGFVQGKQLKTQQDADKEYKQAMKKKLDAELTLIPFKQQEAEAKAQQDAQRASIIAQFIGQGGASNGTPSPLGAQFVPRPVVAEGDVSAAAPGIGGGAGGIAGTFARAIEQSGYKLPVSQDSPGYVPLLATVAAESGGNPNARGTSGEVGFGQLMAPTAAEMGVDPNDPNQNLAGAWKYLQQGFDKWGTWPQAYAQYTAGPGAMEAAGGDISKLSPVKRANVAKWESQVSRLNQTQGGPTLPTAGQGAAPQAGGLSMGGLPQRGGAPPGYIPPGVRYALTNDVKQLFPTYKFQLAGNKLLQIDEQSGDVVKESPVPVKGELVEVQDENGRTFKIPFDPYSWQPMAGARVQTKPSAQDAIPGLNDAQRTVIGTIDRTMGDVRDLYHLADKNVLGWTPAITAWLERNAGQTLDVAGWSKILGIAAPEKVLDFATRLNRLVNSDLNALSGAAISATEMGRLMKGLPSQTASPEGFRASAESVFNALTNEREAKYGAYTKSTKELARPPALGKNPAAAAPQTAPAPSAPGAAPAPAASQSAKPMTHKQVVAGYLLEQIPGTDAARVLREQAASGEITEDQLRNSLRMMGLLPNGK